jgi:hypothetical protein
MLLHNADNVVVVEGNAHGKPIGVARAADILRLRKWVLDEEGYRISEEEKEHHAPTVAPASTLPETGKGA